MTLPCQRLTWFLILAFTALVARAPRARAADEVLRDEWQVLSLGGARVGHEHLTVRRLTDPPRIESTRESRVAIRRLDETVVTSTTETTVEHADGTLLSIHAREKQSAEESTTEMIFAGGKARITTVTMGTRRESVADVPTDLVGPWKAARLAVDAGFPVGKTFDARVFMRQLGGPRMTHATVVGTEETASPADREAGVVRIDQTIDGVPMTVSTWVDREGSTVRMRMTLAGMVVESRRATKEEALAPDDGTRPLTDVFTQTLILSPVHVPHARRTGVALLRVRPRTARAKIPDLATERQTVEATEGDGAVLLRVRSAVPSAGLATRPLADPAAELAPFLAPSSVLQSDDPHVVEAAAAALAGEKDAWKAAQAIERWVGKHLTKKNMGVAFASALEVLRNREGDCTEHAVLVVALCRAAGIPARVVMGLEYLAGVWGGHAWSEAFVAGHWYALDATNAEPFVDALHLTVATSAMAEGSFGEELTALVGLIGSVDIEVLEVSRQGRTIPVAEPAPVRVEGARYAHRLYDLAFAAPPGFEVQPLVPAGLGDRLARVQGTSPEGIAIELVVHAADLTPEAAWRPTAPATTETKVDGRTAYAAPRKDGGHEVRVATGDIVFRFVVSPGGEAGRRVLDALLASVDLDPPAPK